MATKEQVINGVIQFIDNSMIPNAEGNYKIILRVARAGMAVAPDKIWDMVKNNAIVSPFVDGDKIDAELLSQILLEGFGSDEFNLKFKLFGEEYKIFLSKDDVRILKSYIERA